MALGCFVGGYCLVMVLLYGCCFVFEVFLVVLIRVFVVCYVLNWIDFLVFVVVLI